MLVVGALFVLPTLAAEMHPWGLVWIPAVVLTVFWGLFFWLVRTYRPHQESSLFYRLWGWCAYSSADRVRYNIKAWRFGLVLNVLAALVVGIVVTNTPATIAEWEQAQVEHREEERREARRRNRAARQKRREAEKAALCAAYYKGEKKLWDWQKKECEALSKTSLVGWYADHKYDLYMWGGNIAIVLFLTIVVFWASSRIRRPYLQKTARLKSELGRMQVRADDWGRKAQDLERRRALDGEQLIAWEVMLRRTKNYPKPKLVSEVVRVRRAIEERVPYLIPDEDRRDALRERCRRAEEESEAVSCGESADPVEARPS